MRIEAAEGWIRHAARNEVKFLVLVLHPPIILDNKGKKKEKFMMTLDDLPSSPKMETMRLALGGATVRLPTAATFASLADLSLEYLEFADGGGDLLNRLLSPACCPRLRKLRMKSVRFAGVRDLLLEAEALVELTWERLCWNPDAVRLRTPSLRVLRVVDCDLDRLTLSAPRLEELLFFGGQPQLYDIDIVGELSCVRSLKLQLMSHAPHGEGDHDDDDEDMDNVDYDINRVSTRLLNFCTAATCLDIDLYIAKKQDITEDRIPRLPQVTSLTVHATLSELHSFGVGIAHILPQCSNLKYLHIRCTVRKASLKTNLLCDHPDHWRPPHEIYLPHLKEAEFTGLVGTECELRFIQSMLTSTTQLQKATISFDREYNLTMNRINAFERIQMLEGRPFFF
ncbi:unnamed protein product [Urochloa decumbens]|uniref:FBD domain-containing protein n=1 Tax=Urochloa decumbens TaxID=240449 RepID=A0ABC9D1M1_9POAL